MGVTTINKNVSKIVNNRENLSEYLQHALKIEFDNCSLLTIKEQINSRSISLARLSSDIEAQLVSLRRNLNSLTEDNNARIKRLEKERNSISDSFNPIIGLFEGFLRGLVIMVVLFAGIALIDILLEPEFFYVIDDFLDRTVGYKYVNMFWFLIIPAIIAVFFMNDEERMALKRAKEKREGIDNLIHNEEIAVDNAIKDIKEEIRREEQRLINAHKCIEMCNNSIKDLNNYIEYHNSRKDHFYSSNIIPCYYRNLIAINEMLRYIDSGRCNTLYGDGGAIDKYEQLVPFEKINNTLNKGFADIISNLEIIQQLQGEQIKLLSVMSGVTIRINEENKKVQSMTAGITGVNPDQDSVAINNIINYCKSICNNSDAHCQWIDRVLDTNKELRIQSDNKSVITKKKGLHEIIKSNKGISDSSITEDIDSSMEELLASVWGDSIDDNKSIVDYYVDELANASDTLDE